MLRKLSLNPTKCREQSSCHYEVFVLNAQKLLEFNGLRYTRQFSCNLSRNLVATHVGQKIARGNIPCSTHSSQFFFLPQSLPEVEISFTLHSASSQWRTDPFCPMYPRYFTDMGLSKVFGS